MADACGVTACCRPRPPVAIRYTSTAHAETGPKACRWHRFRHSATPLHAGLRSYRDRSTALQGEIRGLCMSSFFCVQILAGKADSRCYRPGSRCRRYSVSSSAAGG